MGDAFGPQTPEGRASAEYAVAGPSGLRAPATGHLEHACRRREQAAFLAGIRWERERMKAAQQAELARVSNVPYPARPLVEHFLEQVSKRLAKP